MDKVKEIIHEGMNLIYIKGDKGYAQCAFTPEVIGDLSKKISSLNFQLAVAGMPYGFMAAGVEGYSTIPIEMEMRSFYENDNNLKIDYYHEKLKIGASVNIEFTPGTSALRQWTTVTNEGEDEITLTHVSSFNMQGIGLNGIRKWYDKKKIKVHYCRNTWQGEGQWRSGDLEELGLYPASYHNCGSSISFSSNGSFSTAKYLPMAIIEDLEAGEVWYFQLETSANWHFEIGFKGESFGSEGSLYIHGDSADERYGGWAHKLMPGESFTAMPAAVGCCKGGFEEAIKELTKYRRKMVKPKLLNDKVTPLVFNDYMNCLSADPTKEKLIPLIDKAWEIGAEIFCIDAGWFGPQEIGYEWGYMLGDWEPSVNRFGEEGLQGILSYIKSKGIIPGIWLEMEVCGEKAKLYNKPDSWFLKRHGKRVGGGMRQFLNFTNIEVRKYIHGVIDRIVSMGVGFIKNDYNDCIGLGDDEIGTTASDGLLQATKAFYDFIDEVRVKHPELIIENCASGAMREDNGILSHFHMQSSTDQETYYKYPSILQGSLAAVLPEQLGVWSYPWPLSIKEHDNIEKITSKEYIESMSDGEQTIFNMVDGLCGAMYLSGCIQYADKKNFDLIKEGTSVYKSIREFIHTSYPVWTTNFLRIQDKNNWATQGFINEEKDTLMMAIWRIGSHEEEIEISLPWFKGKDIKIEQIYPTKGYEIQMFFNKYMGNLTVKLPNNYSGRFIKISI